MKGRFEPEEDLRRRRRAAGDGGEAVAAGGASGGRSSSFGGGSRVGALLHRARQSGSIVAAGAHTRSRGWRLPGFFLSHGWRVGQTAAGWQARVCVQEAQGLFRWAKGFKCQMDGSGMERRTDLATPRHSRRRGARGGMGVRRVAGRGAQRLCRVRAQLCAGNGADRLFGWAGGANGGEGGARCSARRARQVAVVAEVQCGLPAKDPT